MGEYIGVIGGSSGDALTEKLQERGYKVALAVGTAGEPGTDRADQCYIADLRDENAVVEFFQKYHVKKVLIGTGHEVVFELAKRLEKEGFLLSINLAKSLLAKDKIEFKKQLEKQGILTPAYYAVDKESDFDMEELLSRVGLPCVIKSSIDAVQPRKANTMEELEQAVGEVFATKTSLLAEEFIDGGDCTVAVGNRGGGYLTDCGVTLYSKAKEYGLEGFSGAYAAVLTESQAEEIIEVARKVVRENELLGLVRVDFVIDEKIYVLEANSVMMVQPGVSTSLLKQAGYDTAAIMVDNALQIFEEKI